MKRSILNLCLFTMTTATAMAQTPADQTFVDVNNATFAPLTLNGLPAGIEVSVLHGDLAKGGGEILLRTPARYIVPNHSHSSPEVYLWLKGAFTYITDDGRRQDMQPPVFISLPPNSPHALECGDAQCVFYVRYDQPFDLHVHETPKPK